MVVVKWSACSPSTPTILVRIPLKPTVFSVPFVLEKNENKEKEAHLKKLLKRSGTDTRVDVINIFWSIVAIL